MRLIEQMIRKRLELYEEFVMNRHYMRAIWCFYQSYAIALAVLGKTDPLNAKKNMLWRKNLHRMEAFDSKKFKALVDNVTQDIPLVIDALEKLQSDLGKGSGVFGDYYKQFTIGIMSYEYPEDYG